jgi:ATP-dependent Clp protease ATP-binding subunit ClpX
MLEGVEVMVPMDYGYSAFGHRVKLPTRDILFIACGAFSGLDEILQANQGIGFRPLEQEVRRLTLDEVGSFQRYGFLPELIGRFSRLVQFPPLPADTLRQILIDNLLPQFENEFRGEGLTLRITDQALEYIIRRSQKRGVGARGLHVELVAAIEEAAFENFMQTRDAEVIITVSNGQLTSEVQPEAGR